MTRVEGTWYSKSRLLPTGQLKILSTELQQSDSLTRLEMMTVDEIGAKWKITRPIFVWEMEYHELPEKLYAHYWFKNEWNREFVVLADSQEEALTKIKLQEADRTYGNPSYTFTKVSSPEDPIAIRKSNKESK